MSKPETNPAALQGKVIAFGSSFGMLCMSFEPMTAFVLALLVAVVLGGR